MKYFYKTAENGKQYIRPIRTAFTVVGAIVVLMMGINMVNNIKIGYIAIYENSATGTKQVIHGPSFVLKAPFVGNLEVYKKDTTLSFAPKSDDDAIYTSRNTPIKVSFADTYKAQLLLNARMVLPGTDEDMLKLHGAYRTYDNLVRSLYTRTIVDVATNTAQQFTAEEIFQGGLNGLKSAIEDQASNGVYVTQRRKVLSEMGVTERTEVGGRKTDSVTGKKSVYVWKAVPLKDSKGNVKRTKNPLDQYGVQVTQVNLAEPIPEALLEKLLSTKKQLVAKKIASIQKQENAKTNIETAKLEGEANRVAAEQKRLIKADAEVIELKKQVKVAEQQALKEIVEQRKLADLAKINKTKELQIAQANKNIQMANEVAAKYEAQAKLHNGLADAKIKKAMYEAVKPDILKMEVKKVTELARYEAMKVANVTMPTEVTIMGGSDGTGASIQDLTNFAILGMKDSLSSNTPSTQPAK